MDQILLNLERIDWWFDGLFFILVGCFVPKLVRVLWNSLLRDLPLLFRPLNRKMKRNFIVNVRAHREEDHFITWAICRYWYGCLISLSLSLSMLAVYFLSDQDFISAYRMQLTLLILLIAILNQLIFRQKDFIFSLISQNKKLKKWRK